MEGFSTQKVAKRISNPAELRPQSKEKAATRWQPSVSEQRSARIEMSTIEGAAIEKLIFNKRRSNFIRVREQLKPYLIAKYGMIGTFIERDDYPPYPAIPADNAPVFQGLSGADRNKLKDKMLNSRAKYHEKCEEDKVKIFGEMLKIIPHDGLEAMKQRDGWTEIDEEKDPRRLWLMIKTVFGGPGIADNINQQKTLVEDEFYGCKQGPHESDKDYLDRFVLAAQNLQQLGEDYAVEETDKARRFLMKLNAKHSEMVADLLNGVGGGMPQTVAAAYSKISSWVSGDRAPEANGDTRVPTAFFGDEIDERMIEEPDNAKSEDDAYVGQRDNERPTFTGECYVCGKKGHKAYQCKMKKSNQQSKAAMATDEGSEIEEHANFMFIGIDMPSSNALSAMEMKSTTVVLDSGCTAGAFCNAEIVERITEGDTAHTIKGIGGKIVCNQKADVDLLGEKISVNFNKDLPVNLLSFAEIEDKYEITYIRKKGFIIHLENGKKIYFKRKGKLYVCDWNEIKNESEILVSVHEMEKLYAKRDVDKAREARDQMRTLGYPSKSDMIQLINSGGMLNSRCTAEDVERAIKIYGTDVASLKGKTVNQGPIKFEKINVPRMLEKHQRMFTDIFYVENVAFVGSVILPLGLLMTTYIFNDKDVRVIKKAITTQLTVIGSKGFYVKSIQVDPDTVLSKLEYTIPGVDVDVVGPGMHVVIAERENRVIKERCRACIADLPWKIPMRFVPGLVYWTTFMINILMRKSRRTNVSPREAFTGVRFDYKRDIRGLMFGDYVQVFTYPRITNSMLPRTMGAIAMHPTGNVDGGWKFYCLTTGRWVIRNHWKKLPTPDVVLTKIQEIRDTDVRADKASKGIIELLTPEEEMNQEQHAPPNAAEHTETQQPANGIREQVQDNDVGAPEQEARDGGDAATAAPEVQPNGQEATVTGQAEPSNTVDAQTDTIPQRQREYGLHMSVGKATKLYGDAAKRAAMKELKQMIEKEVWTYVDKNSLSKRKYKTILRSSMFLKEKYLANGQLEKLKARLVAGGHMQDKTQFDSVASPTASLAAIMVITAIAAIEDRKMATIDIGGAYLNAELNGEGEDEVLMYLDPMLTSLLTEVDPNAKPYVDEQGRVAVKLKKALYGLVQSALKWYNKLRSVLENAGFKVNEQDACVFNKKINGEQLTLAIHVDDILATCRTKEGLDHILNVLKTEFKEVKANTGDEHSYLGMRIRKMNKGIFVDMENYIKDVIKACNVTGTAKTPHKANLFDEGDYPLLGDSDREAYHSIVMKLLYLAKRTRPDILLDISHHSSRVTKPTSKDMDNLQQLLRYLNATAGYGLFFRKGGQVKPVALIDASYSVHPDGKSRTGIVIMLAGAAIVCMTSKQKLTTKSSTESEIVGLSDGTVEVLWVLEFLKSQGYELSGVTIGQDNMSVLTLMSKTRGHANRTKHLNSRFFFVRDRTETGELKLVYVRTEDMIADILTKPMTGSQFRKFTDALLGMKHHGGVLESEEKVKF